MNSLKNLLKIAFVYSLWQLWKEQSAIVKSKAEQKRVIKDWEKNGKPVPPPQIFKRLIIEKYAKENDIRVFIETGTYLGETLDYFKNYFKKLISVELDQKLYIRAKEKFSNEKHIKIYQGDSGEVIDKVITDIYEPCIFWLDGHYSEGITAKGELNTPILKELEHIFNHKIDNHVVLIDDARCFTGEDDYPTIEFLKDYTMQKNKQLKFSVQDDIIRIHK